MNLLPPSMFFSFSQFALNCLFTLVSHIVEDTKQRIEMKPRNHCCVCYLYMAKKTQLSVFRLSDFRNNFWWSWTRIQSRTHRFSGKRAIARATCCICIHNNWLCAVRNSSEWVNYVFFSSLRFVIFFLRYLVKAKRVIKIRNSIPKRQRQQHLLRTHNGNKDVKN